LLYPVARLRAARLRSRRGTCRPYNLAIFSPGER